MSAAPELAVARALVARLLEVEPLRRAMKEPGSRMYQEGVRMGIKGALAVIDDVAEALEREP